MFVGKSVQALLGIATKKDTQKKSYAHLLNLWKKVNENLFFNIKFLIIKLFDNSWLYLYLFIGQTFVIT